MSSSKKKETTPQSSTKKKKHKHKHTASYVPPSLEKPSPSSKTKLFQKSRLKIHVAVPPAAATTSLETFLHHHLTSNILLKHTDNGTIVAFSNFQAIASTALIRDECPFAWSWFEGDIVLFNPRIGQRIRGSVALSSPDHIALIAYGLFNVSVPRTRMPENWTFGDGVWTDHKGRILEGEMEFEVVQLITTSSILSMLGSLQHLMKKKKKDKKDVRENHSED